MLRRFAVALVRPALPGVAHRSVAYQLLVNSRLRRADLWSAANFPNIRFFRERRQWMADL